MNKNQQPKYKLYLASGIDLWKNYFSKKYSKYFNRKIYLFEPGTLNTPDDHRFIPIGIACHDLNEINHADALLVYMKHYTTLDGGPCGTDSTWECGYAIGHGKPAIMLIEDKKHIDYYAVQWMVSFSINAILTANKEVAEIIKNHPKFVHTTVLLAQNENQFESKIIEYLDNYYRSIYSRSGIINYYVDERARELFNSESFASNIFINDAPDSFITKELKRLERLKFVSDNDSLKVCEVERNITEYLKDGLSKNTIDSAISAVVEVWDRPKDYIIDCLSHSINPPFTKVKGRKHGVKKTRPEIFYELYDLVTHHLIEKRKFIKLDSFPYDIGAVIELYNWMNTYSLDDVFDNSKWRQKLETVWYKFSRRDAIFTGIIGHLLMLKYIFIVASENKSLAKKLATTMNDYNFVMYEGQVLDLTLTFDSKKKKELLTSTNLDEIFKLYIQRIYGICGGFYEAIGELSAKAGNKEEQILNAKQIDKISPLVAMYYGIIQMIRNDLGDYIVVEKESGLSKGMKGFSHSDIEEGKTDIAYLISLNSPHLTKQEKRFLISILGRKLKLKDKLEVNKLLWKSGSIKLVVELIINLIDYVKSNLLSEYQETPTRMKWMFDLVSITKEILIPFKHQALKYEWVKYELDPELLKKLTDDIIKLGSIPKKKRLG